MEKRVGVTIIGGILFMIDMSMLFVFFITTKYILKYYTKDIKVNKCMIWSIIFFLILSYLVESFWSDLSNWGNYLNNDDIYFN